VEPRIDKLTSIRITCGTSYIPEREYDKGVQKKRYFFPSPMEIKKELGQEG
jgi:hypothetical protein